MRMLTTTGGTRIDLDGDVLAILEAISRDLSRQRGLDYGFEEVEREIQHLIGQMTDEDRRTYLKESLFMSFNRFENERLLTVVRRATRAGGHDDDHE